MPTPPIDTSTCPLAPGIEPVMTQPGGGIVVGIELAWGRWRRRILRVVFPGYVRAMGEKRQGSCPDCAHDVIDARDLKYARNVCGFRFRPEDDRYLWRERIPFARPGLVELFLSCITLLPLFAVFVYLASTQHVAWWLPALAVGLLGAEVLWFFRDPERSIPGDADALLSPADGTVTRVDEIDDADFPGGRAFRISIFLSIFNVHVNRVPRTGTVRKVRYFRGKFFDARRPECGELNEQLWLDLEDASTGKPMRVKQIVGALARRIVCQLRAGEEVRAGDRYGMIKFGSRTDLLLPVGMAREVLVRVGDRVKGGITILARVG